MADVESTTTAIITETASITKDAVIPEPMTVDAKESEPITNDVANKHPIKQNEAELLTEGTQLIKSEQFDKACNILSDALRLTQEKGSATTIGSVDYYIAYGEALLRFAQSSNDLFGAAVRQSQQQRTFHAKVFPLFVHRSDHEAKMKNYKIAKSTNEIPSNRCPGGRG